MSDLKRDVSSKGNVLKGIVFAILIIIATWFVFSTTDEVERNQRIHEQNAQSGQ